MAAYTNRKLVHVVFVRHGESEGNLATRDESIRTDEFDAEDSSRYRLTKRGRKQAKSTGNWIRARFRTGFDTYLCSPYSRTKETAALLDIPDARWIEISGLEEANDHIHDHFTCEDGDSTSLKEIKKDAAQMQNYRRFVRGMQHVESFLQEHILGNITQSETMLVVCHANVIRYIQFRLDHLPVDGITKQRLVVHNCEVVWYTSRHVIHDHVLPPLTWYKTKYWCEEKKTKMVEIWEYIKPTTFTNAELLKGIDQSSPYLSKKPTIKEDEEE